jgi:hypothetical protein
MWGEQHEYGKWKERIVAEGKLRQGRSSKRRREREDEDRAKEQQRPRSS